MKLKLKAPSLLMKTLILFWIQGLLFSTAVFSYDSQQLDQIDARALEQLDPEQRKAFESLLSMAEQMETVGQSGDLSQLSFQDLLSGSAEQMVRDVVVTSFSQMSEEETLHMLSEVFQQKEGAFYSPQFIQAQRFHLFLARLLRHPEALPRLASILDQRGKLYFFIAINVLIFIFGLVFKRALAAQNPGRRFIIGLKHWFKRFFIVMGARVLTFIVFYYSEVSSIFRIWLQVYF